MRFEEKLISSLPDTHVPDILLPAKEKVMKTQDIYGHGLEALLKQCNPKSVFLKTSKDTLASDLEKYCPIFLTSDTGWKTIVANLRSDYLARMRSVARNREKEFSSWRTPTIWPTPTMQDSQNNGGPSQTNRNSLLLNTIVGQQDQGNPNSHGSHPGRSENWLTPKMPSGGGCKRNTPGGGLRKLEDQIEVNWQTPEARNQKGYHVQKDGTKTKNLGTQAGNGKLNPVWVETLQGFPVGWTQLSGVMDPNENRIDRLRLLGNAVVPQTAEKAFSVLLNRVLNPDPNYKAPAVQLELF